MITEFKLSVVRHIFTRETRAKVWSHKAGTYCGAPRGTHDMSFVNAAAAIEHAALGIASAKELISEFCPTCVEKMTNGS